jgi:hypothetical protein
VHSIQELAALAASRLNTLQPQGFPTAPQDIAANPQPGPVPGPGGRPGRSVTSGGWSGENTSAADDIAGIALGATTRFFGRAIGRRVKRTYDQAMPVLAARQEAILRDQVAVAERHPDLRACLTDHVVFLAGGSRVLPLPDLSTGPSVAEADALVAQLRAG